METIFRCLTSTLVNAQKDLPSVATLILSKPLTGWRTILVLSVHPRIIYLFYGDFTLDPATVCAQEGKRKAVLFGNLRQIKWSITLYALTGLKDSSL
jgi:hypothetical protein